VRGEGGGCGGGGGGRRGQASGDGGLIRWGHTELFPKLLKPSISKGKYC